MLPSLFRIFIFVLILNGLSISHANAKTTTRILLFGDSIIAGYGLAKKDSLSVYLEEAIKKEGYNAAVMNGGVSGDTTSSGRSRLAWTLEKYKPDVVLLALGGNDVLRGFSPKITKQNLDAMLNILKEQNIQVIFSRVQAPLNLGMEYKNKFDSVYLELADKYNIKLYPFLLENTFGNKALMQSDEIHPNADGVKIIARDVRQYLTDYLKK